MCLNKQKCIEIFKRLTNFGKRSKFNSTCKIVSKLNVKPFHNVNSPLEVPVMSRRPSGVHAKQNTGQRTLLVAVLTKRVVTALNGFSE